MASIYTTVAKKGTFLHTYMQHVSMLETPLSYDFWCGMWLLSSMIGRRTFIARPAAPVWLNTYIVLCAEAGSTRKSTAISKAVKIYRAAGLGKHSALITSKVTPEGVTELLELATIEKQQSWMNVAISELVVFFGRERYSMGLPGLMTDLYDCPTNYEGMTASRGMRIMRNVYVTFIAASTPSWLATAINPNVIEGGFTSRCLFIIEEKPKRRVAWPEAFDESDVQQQCVDQLLQLSSDIDKYASDGISITPAARKRFVSWYENRKMNVGDPFVSSFEAREDHHILRLAALLACNDRAFVIDVHHIRSATNIILAHKASAAELFGSQRFERRIMQGIEKIKEHLASGGVTGLTQAEISYKLRNILKSTEITFILTVMQELFMVQQFELPSKGRHATIWRGTTKLLDNELIAEVRRRVS